MPRTHVSAAGGIVVRHGRKPLVAVVQRQKDNSWVLPKGKLKQSEKPIQGARREAMEETGADVEVYEFLGVISYSAGNTPKIARFWRMQAVGATQRMPTRDIRAVEWLPLRAAIERLSLPHEKLFLHGIGPRAVEAAEAQYRAEHAIPAGARAELARGAATPAESGPLPSPGLLRQLRRYLSAVRPRGQRDDVQSTSYGR